jgi:hypothetical protein
VSLTIYLLFEVRAACGQQGDGVVWAKRTNTKNFSLRRDEERVPGKSMGAVRCTRISLVYTLPSAAVWRSPARARRLARRLATAVTRASPLEDLRGLVADAEHVFQGPGSDAKIYEMVDGFCEEHSVTMDMLTALKDRPTSPAVEAVAARLTSHVLGVLGSSGAQDTSLAANKDRLVNEVALTSEFEAAVSARKAESVLQLIGRKTITPEDLHVNIRIPETSDAVRILEVLVQVDDADTRRAMLVEAFDHGDYEDTEEEEGLWTTPMVLFQAIEERLGCDAVAEDEASVLRALKEDILRDHLQL